MLTLNGRFKIYLHCGGKYVGTTVDTLDMAVEAYNKLCFEHGRADTLTVTAQEADDDFKQIQAAIRADADLTKGGKRKRKQGNKASKTPERASPRGDGVGEEGVKRTAVGSLSPAPRDMNGVDRREA